MYNGGIERIVRSHPFFGDFRHELMKDSEQSQTASSGWSATGSDICDSKKGTVLGSGNRSFFVWRSNEPGWDLKYVFPQLSRLGTQADQGPVPPLFVGHLVQHRERGGLVCRDLGAFLDLNGVEDAVLLDDQIHFALGVLRKLCSSVTFETA